MNLQRSNFRLSHIEQMNLPKELDAKIILQAFKLQQNKRILSSNRAHQIIIQQKTQQIDKIDVLRVTGKQMQSFSPEIHRIKSQKKDFNSIKQVLEKPINNIFKVISEDQESKHYTYELDQLKKIQMNSGCQQRQLYNQINKGIYSHKDLETTFNNKGLKSIRLQNPSQSMQYYEEMILNNPILYRKIINAYNVTKRQQQRQHFNTKNKGLTFSVKRSTFCQTKFIQKSSFSQMAKTHNDSKKFIYFMQYRQFLMSINLSNKILLYPHSQTYKAYICKGNNGLLMKSIIKSRPWWTIKSHNQIQECNLVWTEWKKPKIINSLRKCQKKMNESEIKIIQIHSASKKRQYLLLSQKKQSHLAKIISKQDKLWLKYEKIPHFQNYLTISNKINDPNFQQFSKDIFKEGQYTHSKLDKQNKMHNHLPGCLHLHSKKLLFNNLRAHYQKINKDIFTVLPLTFHIVKGLSDPQFIKFSKYFEEQASSKLNITTKTTKNSNNIWILKPGQNSNRGNGITVLSKLSEIQALVTQKCSSNKTIIIQKYFQNPFLYFKRKFDIRCYILITTVNGIIKGYWYEQGYIRTSSKEFNLKNLDNKFIHLTNDAIQKKGEEYGKFQNFNKISYKDFQKYLQQNHPLDNFKFDKTLEIMKEIATNLILSTVHKLNQKRKQYSFQIFGLDFMLDDRLHPYIIQANSNPCIQVDGNVLSRIIPQMLQNAIKIAIDPIFPPPYNQISKNRFNLHSNTFETNKFVLVYDSYWDISTIPHEQFLEDDKNYIEQQQINEQQIQ